MIRRPALPHRSSKITARTVPPRPLLDIYRQIERGGGGQVVAMEEPPLLADAIRQAIRPLRWAEPRTGRR
jgi:hypothetical protein